MDLREGQTFPFSNVMQSTVAFATALLLVATTTISHLVVCKQFIRLLVHSDPFIRVHRFHGTQYRRIENCRP